VILDWNLPDTTGPEIAKTLRSKKNAVPILMLTTNTAVPQRITGLDAGACDYVGKPCPLEEISARVRALVRRQSGAPDAALEFGDIKIDLQAHSAFVVGKKMKLSPSEFDILAFLVANQGNSFSPEALLTRLWKNRSSSREAIYVHVRHLRERLSAAGSSIVITTNDLGEYELSIAALEK
jgi:DNA-binding response OmpR family regulator